MSETNERVAIGDNSKTPLTYREQMHLDYARFQQEGVDLRAAFNELPEVIDANSPAQVAAVTAFVKTARTFWTTLDGVRKGEKQQWDNRIADVQGFFNPALSAVDAMKAAATARLTDLQRRREQAERQRLIDVAAAERKEAERRAEAARSMEGQGFEGVGEELLDHAVASEAMADHLEKRAAGPTADIVRQHTAGGTVSGRGAWEFSVQDQEALRSTLGALGPHFGLPDLEKAIRAFIKAEAKVGRTPELSGVLFSFNTKAVVR